MYNAKLQQQKVSTLLTDFGNELYDGNRIVEQIPSQSNVYAAEENFLPENISEQAGNVTNQKQKETTQLPTKENDYDLVLREQANNAAAFQMKIHLETEKVLMMHVKTADIEEYVKRDLVKANKLINDLKLKNEEMKKFLKEQKDIAQTIQQQEQLQAMEMKNNIQLFEMLNKSFDDCSKKRSVLESEKSYWQKKLNTRDVFRKKAAELTQSIDSQKSDLTKMYESYVESNVHFTDRSTNLQNQLDRLSSKLSDLRAEKNRMETINANKKANLDEQKQKLIENKQNALSIKTQTNQLENSIEKLAKQRLHQEKMYQEKLSEISEASKSSKERLDNLTNQNIRMKEQTNADEYEIQELETRLQSVKERYFDLKQENEQLVVSEVDITKKAKQQGDELHSQISSLDKKQVELQASLANFQDEKETLNQVLHELRKQNNDLSATQVQVSKSEAELRSSVNLLKDELHDLQSKCESFDNESLRLLLTTEAEGVKRSQEKLNEQDLRHKAEIAEAKNELEQKKAAYEKDVQARIANKDADIQGLKDSVVKTKRQNERELEKLKSHVFSLQSKEGKLRTQCEDLEKTVAEQKQKQYELERQKKTKEKLDLISGVPTFSHNLTQPVPTTSKSAIRKNNQDNLKRVKFDFDSSLGSSCDERPDYDPAEQKRFFHHLFENAKK